MGKFGWSLPPGCNHLPDEMDGDDDTRCCRCHRYIEDAFDALPADQQEASPMFEGFCCWACARDYADAEATKPYYSHEMPRREEYRALAAGAESPQILTEEEAFGFIDDGGYDPCDGPERPCDYCNGRGEVNDWAANPEDGIVPCPKCSSGPACQGQVG